VSPAAEPDLASLLTGAPAAEPDLASLLTGAPAADDDLGYWSEMSSPGALWPHATSVEDLTQRSTVVVAGRVVSRFDGREYKSNETNRVETAPPNPGFRHVELEVAVELVVAGRLAEETPTIIVDIWRIGDTARVDDSTPPVGSTMVFFLVENDLTDADRNSASEALGPEQGQRYIDDLKGKYQLATPQGALLITTGGLISPLLERAPDADQEMPEADEVETDITSIGLERLQEHISSAMATKPVEG
jgi:hypothetical protein